MIITFASFTLAVKIAGGGNKVKFSQQFTDVCFNCYSVEPKGK